MGEGELGERRGRGRTRREERARERENWRGERENWQLGERRGRTSILFNPGYYLCLTGISIFGRNAEALALYSSTSW